jgi:hypothetical protein
MKFRALSLGFAAAFGVASMNVAATVNLNTPLATDIIYFALEASADTPPLVYGGAVGGTPDANFKFGYTLSEGNKVYARLDLSGGTITGADWQNDVIVSTGGHTVILTEGGTVGSAYAIFEVTAVGELNTATDGFDLFFGNTYGEARSALSLAGTTGLSATVRIYNERTAAQSPENIASVAVRTYSGQLYGFKGGFSSSVTAAEPVITTVNLDYLKFRDFADTNIAPMGTVSLAMTTQTKHVDDVNQDLLLSHFFAPTSTLTLSGDLSAAAGVGLINALDSCATATPVMLGTIAEDKASATFTMNAAGLLGVASRSWRLCFAADGATPMENREYTLSFNPVAVEGGKYNINNTGFSNQLIGSIKRDGMILRSGFISKFNMRVSRFIFANTSNVDVLVSGVKIFDSVTGPSTTAIKLPMPQVLKAGTRTALEMGDLIDLNSMPLQNFMVQFEINTTDDKIFGTYQLLLNDSNVQTVVPMERKTSNYK